MTQVIVINGSFIFLYTKISVLVLTVILSLLLVVLISLLLIPIHVLIDTTKNQYFVQLKGLAKANILSDRKELVKISVKVLFFKFSFYPLRKKKTSVKERSENKVAQKKSSQSFKFRKIITLMKSFKIKRLFVNLDTGDCIRNAQMYPLFAFFNYHGGNFNINFEGRNQMVLHLQNRPIRIIRSFI